MKYFLPILFGVIAGAIIVFGGIIWINSQFNAAQLATPLIWLLGFFALFICGYWTGKFTKSGIIGIFTGIVAGLTLISSLEANAEYLVSQYHSVLIGNIIILIICGVIGMLGSLYAKYKK